MYTEQPVPFKVAYQTWQNGSVPFAKVRNGKKQMFSNAKTFIWFLLGYQRNVSSYFQNTFLRAPANGAYS